ncbi:Y-family DNA polymerase [Candidatus Marinimicrobia bacterium]|nr:Y-family DNA polymerase [Candidatus Neomarinimicrobiota bacterium]
MIALADCNNFYASCERVFNPKLKNKPVIVLSNNDGCVIARSNESKKLGIRMGEPVFKVRNIIEKYNVHVFSTNFALYGDMSNRVMSIIGNMVPSFEVYSIDEAFLDLRGVANYADISTKIIKTVRKSTGIPISIGLAKTKTLAKVANYIAKKYTEENIFILDESSKVLATLKRLPISEVWGIGRSRLKMLNFYGVKTAYDFINLDERWVKQKMTIEGLRMQRELKEELCYSIQSNFLKKKSICTSRTFPVDIDNIDDLEQAISNHAMRCSEKLRKQKSSAKYIGVFINTNRFKNQNQYLNSYKSILLENATNDSVEVTKASIMLLRSIYQRKYSYKKSGVIVGDIVPENEVQMNLFQKFSNHPKRNNLFRKIDKINRTMGRDTVRILSQGFPKKWKLKQENLSPCYTTRWDDLLRIQD